VAVDQASSSVGFPVVVEKTSHAWIEAWRDPDLGLRLFYLVFGAVVFYFVGQHAFEASFSTGLSFIAASFLAISRATVFLIIRRIPLGVVAPVLIFCGVIFSQALRPVIFEAKEVALKGDLLAAAIMIGMVVFLSVFASRLKRGELPEG